jgi:hypothetical protein
MSWSLTASEVATLIGAIAVSGINSTDVKALAVVAKIRAHVEMIDRGNGTTDVYPNGLKIVSDE